MTALILNLLLWGPFAGAQTVTLVQNQKVFIDPQGLELAVGDEVIFYSTELAEAGRGRISRITPNGTRAIAELESGQAEAGMHIESSPARKKGYTPTAAELKTMTPPLTPEDRALLARGELGTTRYVIGGILGTYPIGFGLGHAVQKRYHEKGWIFTVGELGSLAVAAAGASTCMERNDSKKKWSDCRSPVVTAGILGFVGFRLWEIADLWITPLRQNRRYRELKERELSLHAILVPQPDGGHLGLRWTF